MSEMFVGIPMGPTSFYDEGIEHTLDVIEQSAGCNALSVYPYDAMPPGKRAPEVFADHGVRYDNRYTQCTPLWARTHEEFYGATSLRFRQPSPGEKYAGKDILADLEEPCRRRGIRVYPRILERWLHHIRPNFLKVHEVDPYGQILDKPCGRNPQVLAFWQGAVEDLLTTYPWVAGIYYGFEGNTPLGDVLAGNRAGCFCESCQTNARDKGIDPDRAIEGFRKLGALVARIHAGDKPVDGAFVEVMRTLIAYPEILFWEREWVRGNQLVPRRLRGLMRCIDESKELGYHADHWIAGRELFKRISFDYPTMAEIYDWVKPCVYHTCMGPRLDVTLTDLHKSIFADLSRKTLVELIYAVQGYDAANEPSAEDLASGDLDRARMSPAYTYREIDRAVKGLAGTGCKVYAGVAMGVPVWDRKAGEDPQVTYTDCIQALEAGADGFMLSREYDEMEIPNLQAVGRAVKDWQG